MNLGWNKVEIITIIHYSLLIRLKPPRFTEYSAKSTEIQPVRVANFSQMEANLRSRHLGWTKLCFFPTQKWDTSVWTPKMSMAFFWTIELLLGVKVLRRWDPDPTGVHGYSLIGYPGYSCSCWAKAGIEITHLKYMTMYDFQRQNKIG